MANLNDKFDVLKGWEPGGDASVDQSFPPKLVAGVPVTLAPGYIVTLDSTGVVDVATTPVLPANPTVTPYVVVEGNDADYSTQFVGKVAVIRGKLTLRTDKLDPGGAFPVAGPVTFRAGLLDDAVAPADQICGTVIANNVTANGTIDVEVDL